MPKRADVVTAKSPYGVKLGQDEDWLNWSKEQFRHDPWEADKVKKGDVVEVEWAESETGKGYISSIKVTGASKDMTPEGGEGAQDESDGQYRSPKDFRRTSALAQAVARHTGAISMQEPPSDEDIILTAQRFEIFLASGT